MPEDAPQRRILIVRLSAIGDVINCLPALTALRQQCPNDYIAWLTEDAPAELLLNHPYLDEVIKIPLKRWRQEFFAGWPAPRVIKEFIAFVARLRRAKFDLLLDLHANAKSGIVSRLSGTPLRIGFDRKSTKEWNHLFTNRQVEPPKPEANRVERYASLLAGLSLDPTYRPGLVPISTGDKLHADTILKEAFNLSCTVGQDPIVILHPATSARASFKQWPSIRFARLSHKLASECAARVLVTYGPGENVLAEAVVSASRGSATLCPPLPSIRTLGALITKAAIFVAADTGTLHLAACLGTPVVGLYGPKDPTIYAPYGSPSRVLRGEVPCSPCSKRACSDPICMRAISVDATFSACKELLEETCA